MSSFITLDVSGHQYKTQKATLLTSPYFHNLLERWESGADMPPDDGSYFIDADPEVFGHLLSFMRRPSKFPLFWTKENGFDYVLYSKLETEADHFHLADLRDWIREGRYKDAVKTIVEVKKVSDPPPIGHAIEWREVDQVQHYFDSFSRKKVYRCPLGVHGPGTRERCGSDVKSYSRCVDLDKANGTQYNKPDKSVVLVVQRIQFDENDCSNKEGSLRNPLPYFRGQIYSII